VPGGADEAHALASGDAGCRSAERRGRALSNLDEYRRRAVARDKVDLAQAAAVIARNDLQTALLEEGRRKCFSGDSTPVHLLLSAPLGAPYSRSPGKRGKCRQWQMRQGMKTPSVNGRRHYM
jgi:hypothetical protein